MPGAVVDLRAIAARLTNRRSDRAEALVQSDLRMLLLAAGLNLRDGDLHDVNLEAPVGVRTARLSILCTSAISRST